MSTVSNFKKLQTLTEDLETVSINDIPSYSHVVKKQNSTTSLVNGLGIHVPKRPSDSIRQKTSTSRRNSASKLTIMERPVSNDSILSSTQNSEFSEIINNNDDDSRNSSITSELTNPSPIMKNNFSSSSIDSKSLSIKVAPKLFKLQTPSNQNQNQNQNNSTTSFKTPMSSNTDLSNLSVSSLSTIKLTPSQRLKLKRQNSIISTRKQKESYFEQHYNSDDDTSVTFDDGLIWNVPFTPSSTVFSPLSGKSATTLKQIIESSPIQMPMSPLPGTISNSLPPSPLLHNKSQSFPVHNNRSSNHGNKMYRHPTEAQSLSRFYEVTNNNHIKNELNKRQNSMVNLPSIVKTASDLGLDDMRFYSEEKIQSISTTRQICLPPKSPKECQKHEHDAIKMFEKSAKIDRLKRAKFEESLEIEKKNVIRWGELNSRGLLRNSSIYEIKKLVFKCSIPDYLKYEVWNSFLKFEINKKKNDDLINDFEKFDILTEKLSKIPNLPNDKIEYLKDLIIEIKKNNSYRFNSIKDDKLLELLKLRLISKLGLDSNIDLKLMSILLLKFNLTDCYNLTNLLKLNTFNNEIINKKFNDNLSKNYVIKKYLDHKEYSKDLQQLSFTKMISIILKLTIKNSIESEETTDANNQLIFQIFDILIVNNDYKTHYALIITILRHYHFGFIDIDDLLTNPERQITVADKFQFFEHFYHYHKKF